MNVVFLMEAVTKSVPTLQAPLCAAAEKATHLHLMEVLVWMLTSVTYKLDRAASRHAQTLREVSCANATQASL